MEWSSVTLTPLPRPKEGPRKVRSRYYPPEIPAETFATLVHEVAHSDMHFGDRRAATDKRIRETEAESVAYVVCSAIGMNPGTSGRDYIGLYGGDANLLLASLEYVQATASFILTALEVAPQQKAA